MKPSRFRLVAILAGVAALAGCATPPPPDPAAEVPHCYRSSRGRVIACTSAPAPSLNADAEAKRFAPDPSRLTVYVVRRNWGDGSGFVNVYPDGGPGIETVPRAMVRLKFAPGEHSIAFEYGGKRQTTRVEGKAGDLRFLRFSGTAWTWGGTYEWVEEPEASTRALALRTRLVADVDVR